MPFFIIVLFYSVKSQAIFDFIGEEVKKVAEASAYIEAVTDLTSEIEPDSTLETGTIDLKNRTENLRRDAAQARYLSRTSQSVLQGPDWSSKRLETNIRSTTEYVSKVKRLLSKIILLGTDGAVALNTTQTNMALNEMQRNQQALIMQNEDLKLRQIEKEQEEARQWSYFSTQQRKLRRNEGTHGKLH